MNKLKILIVAAALVSVLSAPAYAKHGGEGHGNAHRKEMHDVGENYDGHGRRDEEHQRREHHADRRHDGYDGHRFDDQRRQHILSFMREDFERRCPPGLAKKHNGCLPPGHARKLYHIGGFVPHGHHELPEALIVRLGPPPPGVYYAMVDNDVLLVSEATKKIVDAITLMSAVGR